MSGEPILTFVVFACHMNVAPISIKEIDLDADKQPGGCQVFHEQILTETDMMAMTPMKCMMMSPVAVSKFMEGHPGMEPRKWTCKYIRPYAKV